MVTEKPRVNYKKLFQALGFVTFVAAMYYQFTALQDILPPTNLKITLGLIGVYLVFRLFRTFWGPMKAKQEPEPGDWILLDPIAIYVIYLPLIGGMWLLLPYVSETIRIIFVYLQLGTAMVIILGSIRHAPSPGFGAISPVIFPISCILFVLVYQETWAIGVAAFFAAATAALFVFRNSMQKLLNENYYAQREAERERDAKNRFIESASHDLRQPLQAASLSFDQVVGSTGDIHEKAVRRVRWSLDTTRQLLTRMIEHLRLESGNTPARMEVVELGPLIARAAEIFEPAAMMQNSVIHAMPSQKNVSGDADLIERIIGNYVTNAIKHGKAGRILIGARRNGEKVRIWVIDDGTGVASADQDRLFDDYFQGSDHGDEIRGGFGLGLASARRMAELMSGTVGYENRWKSGSAFWFELAAA